MGYVSDCNAVVDPQFQNDELKNWLEVKQKLPVSWKDGVYDKLAFAKQLTPQCGVKATQRYQARTLDMEANADKLLLGGETASESVPMLKACRIWQLKPDVDIGMKFIGFDELAKNFGEPDIENYNMVFDGEIDTNKLEEIYTKFNVDHPATFTGHSLSMSDMVELYDDSGSEFHYVDHFGFKEVKLEPPTREQSMSM